MIRADIDQCIDECADRDYRMIEDRKKIMRLVEKSNKNLIPAENILRERLRKIGDFRNEINRIYSEMGELK
jgi:Fe2+ or Zn2+ uptake regulation protein